MMDDVLISNRTFLSTVYQPPYPLLINLTSSTGAAPKVSAARPRVPKASLAARLRPARAEAVSRLTIGPPDS